MLRIIVILALFLTIPLTAKIAPKRPSDVYAYAMLLKKEVEYLRKKAGIDSPFPVVTIDRNKQPRHVIQKALEILSKINRYRLNNNYGAITIPPYPPREITPQDVYDIVRRLDGEVRIFIDNNKFLERLKVEHFEGKTPSDVYMLLWSISLGFDALLGIHGYTPTDVYALSEKVVRISQFLRHSQNIYDNVKKPKKKENMHPNHALYTSINFLKKIAEGEKRLWIEPADIPNTPHRVITPTEVYDALQYNIAELQRIKYRLGLERYFETYKPKEKKTPSDVVQNIEYALALLPDFSFKRKLVQYPVSSLKKTPNQVYAVTEEILRKLYKLKTLRGIQQVPKNPPEIGGLKPIHAYQKGIEAIEKAQRLKIQMGFYPSQVPTAPYRPITPSEVYELILRLDGIVTLLLKKAGDNTEKEYIYETEHSFFSGKTPSDVYYNLWKISRLFDVLSGSQYTPNETYSLAARINKKILLIAEHLGIAHNLNIKLHPVMNKQPKDVFELTVYLYEKLKYFQKRANMSVSDITIPREDNITPNTVYNALRLINAGVNELLIKMGIDAEEAMLSLSKAENKTPSDVYALVNKTLRQIEILFKDSSYSKIE
ncbi:hypothetical protein [Hydrogenimonas thermophila]|uniref:Uncharacterized protein n=1 Tax=Hydrogenimonas thermophila TaxID=223786 RepID=A0A1I5R7H5_9BACT|nr:hypothetical protein [Hydrogenimonas thermophila]WOE70699.1 hypothetical protein RZR91_03790 [Hydrogenimonas thermophila]WOE73217.1 hypothetical protein RZR97_03780 [Hydrogenimonas thermophila]SFP54251.1 hypothetical protein SAMN05216234_12510 [Hydrogenimonas thermophila]